MIDDIPNPPSDDGPQKPPCPLQSLRKKKNNWLATTALTAAAYDDPELVAQCSPGERNGAIVRGTLVIFYTVLLAVAFAVIGHDLLQSSFSLTILVGAIFLAAFLGLVDHYVMLRAAIFPDGMKGLRHGGFPIDVPIGAGFSSRFCKALRICLSLGLGGVTALFLGLALNSAAVNQRITLQHLAENKALVHRSAQDFDDRRQRASKAYDSAVETVKKLTDETSRLLRQSRRNATSKVADRLAANEARLPPAQVLLEASKKDLDALDANRPQEIEKSIQRSAEYISKNDSLIARLKALFAEIHEDGWTAAPIAIFDLVILGIDAVILTLKGIAMPSTYSMRDTRRHLGEMVRQARQADGETEGAEQTFEPALAEDGEPEPAEDHSEMNGSAKRGPGRPVGSKDSKPRKKASDQPIEEAAHA